MCAPRSWTPQRLRYADSWKSVTLSGQQTGRRSGTVRHGAWSCPSSRENTAAQWTPRSTSVKAAAALPAAFPRAQSTFFRLARLLGLHLVRETFPQRSAEAVSVTEEGGAAAAAHTGLPEQQDLPGSLDLRQD